MFKNSNNDNDIEAGHTRSGRAFKEVHLVNLFKKNYREEGFYSGEEVELTDDEHSEPARAEEGKVEELHREEPKTSETAQTIEVSTVILPIDSILINQGRSMANEMRLPIFRGDGSEDPDQHWFLCEAIQSIKKATDEAVKRNQFSTTLRDRALNQYMKFISGPGQPKPLNAIKTALSAEFKKPKLESQCIIELKQNQVEGE